VVTVDDIDPATSVDGLEASLVAGVGNAGPALIEALMADPEDFATFLAVAFAGDAVKLAVNFACRGLGPAWWPSPTPPPRRCSQSWGA